MRFSEQECIRAVTERQVAEDLFSFPAFVVTIKERGRVYGALSKQLVALYPHITFPILGRGLSSALTALPDGKRVIFTCLWNDVELGEGYPRHVITSCTASAIRVAAEAGCQELGIPLVGGGKKFQRIPFMGRGILETHEQLEARGIEAPDVLVAMGARWQGPGAN